MTFSVLEAATPILLAALGGLLSERGGVLNIALEGMILAGAFWSVVAVSATGSAAFGIVAGVLAGALLGVVFVTLALGFRANVFIVGLGINLLSIGINQVVSTWIFGTSGVIQLASDFRLLGATARQTQGFFAEVFVGHSAITYMAWLLVPGVALFLSRHPWGLRVRVAGSAPELLVSRGINVNGPRSLALILSGALSGLAGAGIVLRLGAYLPGVSGGRGWIALVVIFLGYRRPVGVLLAALGFTLAEAIAIRAQGLSTVSPTLLLSLPYLLVFGGLILYAVFRRIALGDQREQTP
jgi:general nucleoside transport system permease protein